MSSPDILRVAIQPKSGVFSVNVTSSGETIITGGYEAGLVKMLLQGMQMDYTFHCSEDGEWGNLSEDGNWTGLIGMIQRREVDMAVGTIGITEQRMEAVEFSYPYTIKEITFATKLPGILPRHSAFARPFGINVWISLLIALVVLPFVFRFVIFKTSEVLKIIFTVLAILLRQSVSVGSMTYSNKMFLSIWIATAMLISSIYSSVLLAFLTVPLREDGIQNSKQLAEALKTGSYTCASIKGTNFDSRLVNSAEESARTIGNYIVKNKWYVESTKEECAKYFQSGNTAIIWSRESIEMRFHHSLFVSKDVFFSSLISIALRKDFSFRKKLNKVIYKISESGIYQKDVADFTFRQKLSSIQSDTSDDNIPKTIELDDLYGAFILLISGLVLASVTFTLEIICDALHKHKRDRA